MYSLTAHLSQGFDSHRDSLEKWATNLAKQIEKLNLACEIIRLLGDKICGRKKSSLVDLIVHCRPVVCNRTDKLSVRWQCDGRQNTGDRRLVNDRANYKVMDQSGREHNLKAI